MTIDQLYNDVRGEVSPTKRGTTTAVATFKLEDLNVLRRSPDLLNNVKIGQGLLQLIMEQILFYNIWGCSHFGQVT